MLTILNTENISSKEFSYNGKGWILYGIDYDISKYTFIFIPMEAGRYDAQKAAFIMLDKYKKNGLGYKLYTVNGFFKYIHSKDIRNWNALVEIIFNSQMIC